jgi:dTDP-4-dehydrorhamnose reductase
VRILVTGASGMLGSTLTERWRRRHEVFATGGSAFDAPTGWVYRPFDLAAHDHAPIVDWARPEVIVHCAAWTAVDACETNEERALEINGRSVERLLRAAPNARMIYISTEAVFGAQTRPMREEDIPEPINVYGRSKRLGETLLGNRGVSVRTTVIGWNLDARKRSFIEWLTRSLQAGTSIGLFGDAVFTPIAASELADELEVLAQSDQCGPWHVTGREHISKHDFGVRLCEALGLDRSLIRETRIADMRFAARRSADQRLAVASYERFFNRRLPTVARTIEALVRDRITER